MRHAWVETMSGRRKVIWGMWALLWLATGPVVVPEPAGCAACGQEREPVASEELRTRVAELLARLDDGDFRDRNDASRQLAQAERDVLPLLVAALGHDSREVRFRVQALLASAFDFDDVAPWLIQAVPQPYGATARLLLRDRALVQIADAADLPAAKLLFEFWGTDSEELRRQVMFHVLTGAGEAEVRNAVQPLMGLRRKALRFQDFLARLQALSLTYEHRQGPGHAVARALATGLREQASVKVELAERYVEAFETLARELSARGETPTAIRKEVTDRATMSDGAVHYVLQRASRDASQVDPVLKRIRVAPALLADELFRGLSTPDSRECYRCVGKVHIVDMLEETLRRWPEAPQDGTVAQLVDAVVATVAGGDKPKALVLLDALEGCRQLAAHGPQLDRGWSERCAHRLCLAALVAPHTRAYHPARSVHDRFVQLAAGGIAPDDAAFPAAYCERYLAGDAAVLADDARFALGQYVGVVEKLHNAGVGLTQPGTVRFLALLQEQLLTGQRQLLAEGAQEVARLLPDGAGQPSAAAASAGLDQALAEWVDRRPAGR